MGVPGKRRTGGQSHTKKGCKTLKRKNFLARHIDQVWEDVRKETPVHDGAQGPVGTTAKVELDDDLPALGKYYCTPCSRYFIDTDAMARHVKGKPHKRRVKELMGPKPHSGLDAELAAGMGRPDNGPSLGRAAVAMDE